MLRLIISFIVLLTASLGLASCGGKLRVMGGNDRIYDVRRAVVTANAGISGMMIAGVQRRVDMAIKMTRRPIDMPRVVMDIRINSVRKGMGLDGGQSEAQVSVTLLDASEGQPFLETTIPVYSYSLDPAASDEALAEAIAARIRYAFALKVPAVRPTPYRQPRLSTQMSDDPVPTGPIIKNPVLVPAKAIKTIGADADPVLNSKTKVEDKKPAAKVEPALKSTTETPSVDEGAAAKVKIAPAAEPCVETMDQPCPVE